MVALSPGAVFQPALFVNRLAELLGKGCQFMYFDKYQSKDQRAESLPPVEHGHPEPRPLRASGEPAERVQHPDLYAAMLPPSVISYSAGFGMPSGLTAATNAP